jgi:hypothetical protein
LEILLQADVGEEEIDVVPLVRPARAWSAVPAVSVS